MKIKFYDTSALIENIDNLDKDERIYISSISLLELEDLKRTNKASAQKVLRKLEDNEITATIVIYQTSDLDYLGDCGFEVNNDIKIICTALKLVDAIAEEEDELWFISNDFAQRQIAKLFISSERVISEYPPVPERYKGYLEVQMTNDEMSEFYSNLDYNFYNLLTNQYLLIYNEENECVDIYCWTGETHRPITYHTFDSKYFGRVKPYKDDIYQQMLFDSFAHNDVTLVSGPAGSGKACPNWTKIPTKNGYKLLGDIKVGDMVLDRFGNETKVLGVYPQGLKENYKVTFSDGRYAYCNNEHLWSYRTSKKNLKTITLQEMIDNGLQTPEGDWRYKIPRSAPVEFDKQDYDIDPYVMGVLLGDGCCKDPGLTISSADEEIIAECARLLGATSYSRQSDNNYSWQFYNSDIRGKGNKNIRLQTKKVLNKYLNEVAVGASEKRIPEIYKRGSIEQRFALLQGLLDTDGTIDSIKKGRVRFTSISLSLIKDIQEICWSLGMSANITTDNRENKYPITGVAYGLDISCPKQMKPNLFRLSRKKEIAIGYANNGINSTYSDTITIKNIEKMPHLEEMTCILVDNDEHLFLTEQYVVTHNTYNALAYLFHLLERGKIDRIVIFCNPVVAKNAAKLGFYPGTQTEKLLSSQVGGVLKSKLGSDIEVERLIDLEQLVLIPVGDARGYETPAHSGVYVLEAQNLDSSLLRLILQRVGEEAKVIVDGDYLEQLDLDVYAQNNGMRRMSEVFRGTDVYGQVELQQIHRSKIANIADNMRD